MWDNIKKSKPRIAEYFLNKLNELILSISNIIPPRNKAIAIFYKAYKKNIPLEISSLTNLKFGIIK